MRYLTVILISVLLFSSCGEAEVPISEPLTLEEKLLEVMKMPLATGTGKLVRSVSYCCSPQRPFSVIDFYYPVGGEFSYRIQKGSEGDTLEISLQVYEDEKLRYFHSFRFGSGMILEWMNSDEYVYDSELKLMERYVSNEERPRNLVANYRYDEKGRLTRIETFAGNDTASQQFAYNEEGRISREWSKVKTDEEVESNFMFYRYEGELLVAKEASQNARLEGLRKDWYRYIYDKQGRVSALYEFDPYFFFQQKNYAEFFYD